MNQLNDILIEAKRYEFREVDGKTRLTVVTPETTYHFMLDTVAAKIAAIKIFLSFIA